MDPHAKLLLPSMMCADFGHLSDEVNDLEIAGADGFHLDLMDGTFVPNYGMGLQDMAWICAHANVPCDVHMMVEQPGRYVRLFTELGARVIYVHPEADPHVARTLAAIRDAGAKAGIAINPGTSFAAVEPARLCRPDLAGLRHAQDSSACRRKPRGRQRLRGRGGRQLQSRTRRASQRDGREGLRARHRGTLWPRPVRPEHGGAPQPVGAATPPRTRPTPEHWATTDNSTFGIRASARAPSRERTLPWHSRSSQSATTTWPWT